MPGKHFWSAIWMLPTQYVYRKGIASTGSGLKHFGIHFSAHFHYFSIEWDCDQIRWFVDNQQFHNETLIRSFWSKKGVNPYTSIRQPFDQKFQFTFDVMA